jgi:hypothetical protein
MLDDMDDKLRWPIMWEIGYMCLSLVYMPPMRLGRIGRGCMTGRDDGFMRNEMFPRTCMYKDRI